MIPDLFGASSPPALRRPQHATSFGGAVGGALAGALAAVGAGSASDPWQRAVGRIAIELGVAPAVDTAEVTLAVDAHAPSFSLADEGTIALGYQDEGTTAVFAGTIVGIRRAVGGHVRLTVANGTAGLAALRMQQSYESQTAGQVVSALAAAAGVDPGDIADGPDLAYLVLDGSRSAWGHIARLARISGHVARVNADGALDFLAPDDGDPVQTFAWGGDVLALERTESPAAFDAVSVHGEGAAGSQGADAWNWLVKQRLSITGEAGGGSRARSFTDRALRTADAVRAAAQAVADAAARGATRGTLRVPGAPKVVPGRRVALAGTPGGALDGPVLVTRVRHTFDKRAGFRTEIAFVAAAGGAAGLPGLP
jgi:phage protein D